MSDTQRHRQAEAFALSQGWSPNQMTLIAGDASNRKYYRLSQDHKTALVMDAPPEKGEDTRPFTHIATWLSNSGFSAPQIRAKDTRHGFLLIEDFGDGVFARLIEAGMPEAPLYQSATDVLIALHAQTPPTGLTPYNAVLMAEMASLAVTWYRTGVHGNDTSEPAETLRHAMLAHLQPLDAELTCLVQRDYHAENLIWLPERAGIARVGLLDFQDAMLGHPAYDLVSVLQDARRDVSPALADAMLERYIAARPVDPDRFRVAYHVLGLQRNLRILGVFARLCMRDGKPNYLPLIPRVWDHILHNLAVLGDPGLTAWITGTLPAPTDDALAKIATA